jgi:hypothetical protein
MMTAEAAAAATYVAFKEWAVAVSALRAGESIATVRKGGIREEAREFRMEHRRFAFFPTYEHQNREQLQPRHLPRLEETLAAPPPQGVLQIDTWAEVTDVVEVREDEQVQALEHYYVFSALYALERLHWRPKKPLHVLLLRVYRLQTPISVPLLAGYGGCKSWIELSDPVPLDRKHPAMDDATYEALRSRALASLRAE